MTWNVNSIKIRQSNLTNLLTRHQPDVVCLQEIKGEEGNFPFSVFDSMGYHALVFGQKAYNGVAILSTTKPILRTKGIPGFEDPSARYIEAQIQDLIIASIYAPNGESLESPKFQYKVEWYHHVTEYLSQLIAQNVPYIMAGDFNIAPNPTIDTTLPATDFHRIHSSPQELAIYRKLLTVGLIDSTRYLYPEKEAFTWWDYRSGSFQRNKGMRIDHLLMSSHLISSLVDSIVDKKEREAERPSDHAPLIVTFKR